MPSLTDYRSKLNASLSAFQARGTDVDRGGTVFVAVLCVFLLALLGRYLLVALSPVPVSEAGISQSLALCVLTLSMSMLFAKCGFVEATLLLRAAAIAFSSLPWTLSACAIVFHIGRQSPFVDAWLAAADHRLGFDWLTYVRWVDDKPILWQLFKRAYQSIFYQVQIVCVVLAFTRSATRLYAFLLAQYWSLVVVACISIFTPALGTYLAFGAPQGIAHYSDFLSPDWVASTIMRLRGTSFFSAIETMPLITFPSYHACSAVLFAWALWKTPYVRWLALALNLAMLAATPVLGCHYLVDVLAGSAVASAVAFLAGTAVHRLVLGSPRPAYPAMEQSSAGLQGTCA